MWCESGSSNGVYGCGVLEEGSQAGADETILSVGMGVEDPSFRIEELDVDVSVEMVSGFALNCVCWKKSSRFLEVLSEMMSVLWMIYNCDRYIQ